MPITVRMAERRFNRRVATDMPIAWCAIDDAGCATAPSAATCVDISSFGIAFLTAQGADLHDGILVHVEHELLEAGFAISARIVRVSRAPGGYRLAAVFEAVDARRRAALGRFVIALISSRAA
jgi:c-di-GMP-binding flagellar brake protein YcgR